MWLYVIVKQLLAACQSRQNVERHSGMSHKKGATVGATVCTPLLLRDYFTMAGQGAKKRLEENRKRLQALRIVLFLGVASQLAILYLAVRKGTWATSTVLGLVSTTAVGYACYATIASIATPVYENGELIDGGGDLNRGGINGYAHDILYITAFVQITTLISSWFWYAYLTIPAYALFKLTQQFIIPYFQSAGKGSQEPSMDAATRKKLQRAEDRAQRRRNKWA